MLAVLALTNAASAHALLKQSDPGAGAVLQRVPFAVTLAFTEEPEPALSTIQVVDANGRTVSDAARPVPGSPLVLRAPIHAPDTGVYTVSWRTVSRVDGHVTGGAFAFGVGVSPAAAVLPGAAGPAPSTASIVSRWLFYLGLAGLTGVAWVWTIALPAGAAATPSRPIWWWSAVALAGVVGIGFAQAQAAGVGIGRLLATSLGFSLALRALPIVVAALVFPILARRPVTRRWGFAIAGVSAAAAMLAHVTAGHAGAAPGPLRPVYVAVQWLHFLSIAVWLGGLAALLEALGRVPAGQAAAATRRFSVVAGVAILLVAVTGVLGAVVNVGTWEALVSTDYGWLVIVKAALLAALAALGAVNRYRVVPRMPQTTGMLRRVAAGELAIGAIVLLIVGLLTGLAPARQAAEAVAAARPVVVTGHDFATSVRVRLEVTPGFPGANHFVLRAADYDAGRPIADDRVSLSFRSVERPDLGTSTLELRSTGGGIYTGDGANLSLGGAWTVTALLQRAATAVDVPLTVTPKARPQTIRTITAPGQPTLYNIDLGGGVVLDSYLDPGRPGFNEIHATFIAANGQELPVGRVIAIAAGRAGQAVQRVPVRRFGPGHFIGDAQLGRGTWHIEFSGAANDGTVLDARLDVTL